MRGEGKEKLTHTPDKNVGLRNFTPNSLCKTNANLKEAFAGESQANRR
jgi:hypothetical protein